MSLYKQALDVVKSELSEQLIPMPANLPAFRKYICVLSKKHNKKIVTRVINQRLFIKQYYEN